MDLKGTHGFLQATGSLGPGIHGFTRIRFIHGFTIDSYMDAQWINTWSPTWIQHAFRFIHGLSMGSE